MKGKVLDPCCGDGVFLKYLPSGTHWCEIRKGRDFFSWKRKVDWIVSNPPYSIFLDFLTHSFEVADNVVYVIPLIKVFNSLSVLNLVRDFGGIKTCLVLGLGKDLSFPQAGYPIAAVHFQKDYKEGMQIVL